MVILECFWRKEVICPTGPAFGDYSEKVWVELTYPTTLHRDCFIACRAEEGMK